MYILRLQIWMGKVSMHDRTFFQPTKVGRDCINNIILPFRLIEDCAYPMQSWIYNSIKGCPKGVEGYEAN